MNSNQIYKVARREYLARVKSKAFLFTTLLVPTFLAFYILILPVLFSSAGTEQIRIALLDVGTGLSEKLKTRLENLTEPRIEVVESEQLPDASESSRDPFTAAVRAQELDGYIVLEPDSEILARSSYFARETGNPVILRRLENAVESTILEEILAGSGVDVQRVRKLQRSDLNTVTISEEGEESGGFEAAFFSTLALGMLLYMAVLINGQGMAMAIVEEKSSRLIEVILGAVTAIEFMVGKIIGVVLSGLTQLSIWVACALIAVLYALPALSLTSSASGFDLGSVLNPRLILYFAIFFALGYLLYTTLFAAVAATCNSPEELGQALFPAMLPIIIALFATFYAVPNPSTTVTRVLSLVPLFTPLVMLARVNVLMPPLWELWLSILLLISGIVVMAYLSGKVFRFALLMHGKRPTFREIWRMLRAS